MDKNDEIQTYDECLKMLYKQHKIKLGLSSTSKINEIFNYPCDQYKTIHVAGTNGKGSTCYKIYTLLKLKNWKVGIFTSPHIVCLRERIMVNDELISEKDLIYLVNKIWKKSKEINIELSFFEIITMVAFLHFLNKRVDYAVIETGLGGREDATNILKKPEVIVITSIGYDHMHILGNDLLSICQEKIGIFKKNTNIVIGPSVSIFKNVFEKAKEMNCKLVVVAAEPRGETANEEISRIALQVLNILNVRTTDFLNYVLKIKLPLRLQYLAPEQINYFKNEVCLKENFFPTLKNEKCYGNPHAVIFDISHNETAIDQLCRDINYFHKHQPVRICVTITKPRNIDILKPFMAHFSDRLVDLYYIPAKNSRTYTLVDLIQMVKNENNLDKQLKQIFFESCKKMLRWLNCGDVDRDIEIEAKKCKRGSIPIIVKNVFFESCKDNSILLLTGSFFSFEEILDTFHIYAGDKDPIYMNEALTN